MDVGKEHPALSACSSLSNNTKSLRQSAYFLGYTKTRFTAYVLSSTSSASSKILYEPSQINTIADSTQGILRSFSLSLQETSSEKLGSLGICLRAFVVALLEKKVCSSDSM